MLKKFTRKDRRTNIEKEIESVISIMASTQPASDEYKAMSENLVRLCEALEKSNKRKVSPDTKWIVAANLIGMVLVLGYEKSDIIRSKAFGMILKGRV